MDVTLEIPRGQDVLVADGQADDVQMEPQRVRGVDGHFYWRIPGSSLRGLFRRWFHHLAAREQIAANRDREPELADAAHHYEQHERSKSYTGDNLGWCFVPEEEREHFKVPEKWSVSSLFGSCFHPGRIKISDAYARASHENIEGCDECQTRMHVAVDRVTGGAAEGMLFDNRVLVPSGESPKFPVRISIRDPREHEVRWLAQTLIALHIGVLRVGSSKSSGRLALAASPVTRGPHAESLNQHLAPVSTIH